MKNIPTLILATFLFASCSEKEVLPPIQEKLTTYLPAQAGKFRLYEVLDTTYDTRGAQAKQYLIRENYLSQTTNLNDSLVVVFQRDFLELGTGNRFDSKSLFQYLNAIGGRSYLVRQEDNLAESLLSQPLRKGTQWNGNNFTNLETAIFEIAVMDTTWNLKGKLYPDCVLVKEQINLGSLIRNVEAYSVYAKNIGRILKYRKVLVFDKPNGGFNPDKSFIYREALLSHNYQ